MGAGALVAALILSGLLLTLAAPRVLSHWTLPRRSPAAGLLLWQSVALSGVVSTLLAAPVAAVAVDDRHPLLLGSACLLSAVMLGRVLWSGHFIGTDLRRTRKRQGQLVDLAADRLDDLAGSRVHDPVAVLADDRAIAYCLPGRRDRIILSRSVLARLERPELAAVLTHEQRHLDHRHDLLLELFTVLHEAAPEAVRAPGALPEVHLLAEILADRAAVVQVGPVPLARALVAMATAAVTAAPGHPAVAAGGEQLRVRIGLLTGPAHHPALTAALVALAVAVLALPLALTSAALLV